MNIFDPKHNGNAKEIRHYLGSLIVFFSGCSDFVLFNKIHNPKKKTLKLSTH